MTERLGGTKWNCEEAHHDLATGEEEYGHDRHEEHAAVVVSNTLYSLEPHEVEEDEQLQG
jgi:hypothetical protein